jgi:hypothetical protein
VADREGMVDLRVKDYGEITGSCCDGLVAGLVRAWRLIYKGDAAYAFPYISMIWIELNQYNCASRCMFVTDRD